MALRIKHQNQEFGVGDRIKVYQRIKEGGSAPGETSKTRVAFFEGMVLGIKGEGDRKTFTVRRVGEAGIGIERIFPISLPTIEKIEVVKKGTRGVKQAKLYYVREKSTKEIDKIYSRSKRRELSKVAPVSAKVSRGKKDKPASAKQSRDKETSKSKTK